MDSFRKNSRRDLVKASSILANNDSLACSPTTNRLSASYLNTNTTYSPSETEEQIPTVAPPAYHTIISPTMPIPNITSPPYDPLPQGDRDCDSEPDSRENSDNDTPDITINAATQIRGHGNIISIAQMDSVRIANLITTVLAGNAISPCSSSNDATSNTSNVGERPITPFTPMSPPTSATREHTSTTHVRGVKRWCNINITVNCGATVIGDRNIVGPGLGDVARQMQIAQRNQAALLAQQRAAAVAMGQSPPPPPPPQQQQQQQPAAAGMVSPPQLFAVKPLGGLGDVGAATPPMSRSSSLNSEGRVGGGRKRKSAGDDGVERIAQQAKKRC